MSISTIKYDLDLHFAGGKDADLELAKILHRYANAAWLAALLAEIRADELQSRTIASRSYLHGNGFYKIVLLAGTYKLRLHVWMPGAFCEENIHDHRWGLASSVVAGILKSESWQQMDSTQHNNAFEHVYHAAEPNRPAFTECIGPCNVRRVSTSTRHAGEYYCMPPESMHRICSHGEHLVATLMCSSAARSNTTRLITMASELLPATNPQRLTPTQLFVVFDALISVLTE